MRTLHVLECYRCQQLIHIRMYASLHVKPRAKRILHNFVVADPYNICRGQILQHARNLFRVVTRAKTHQIWFGDGEATDKGICRGLSQVSRETIVSCRALLCRITVVGHCLTVACHLLSRFRVETSKFGPNV